MYVPPHFAADDPDALIDRLARRSAALLVTADMQGAPFATHLPILWDAERKIATGHIARANPHHTLTPGGRALIVLAGPEAYVSPSLYPTKQEHGRVVPTWNYEAVHLSGAIKWFDDAHELEGVVRALTERHEGERSPPWSVDDAPAGYVQRLLGAIVGVRVAIDRIEAKRKLSQNKSAADIAGVKAGLLLSDDQRDRELGALMQKQ